MMLAFSLAEERYGIDWRSVAAVVPLARLRAVGTANAAVAGLLDYQGASLPVVDLCRLILGRPCARLLSTRILIVDCTLGRAGLMVERANETLDIPDRAEPPEDLRIFQVAGEGEERSAGKAIELGHLLGQTMRSFFPGAEN